MKGNRADGLIGLFIFFCIGFLWKDKSDDGVRSILEKGLIPLDRLLIETDAPFMYPNVRGSKIPANIKQALSDRYEHTYKYVMGISFKMLINSHRLPGLYRSLSFLNRYCTFQRNEPCSLPVIVEMIAAYMKRPVDEVAMATTINAIKLFGFS